MKKRTRMRIPETREPVDYLQQQKKVGPLVKSKWDQMNSAGCWAVAVTQTCGYFQFPQQYSHKTYNWSDIRQYRTYYYGSYNRFSPYEGLVEELINDVSQACDARNGGTATKAAEGMRRLGFSGVYIDRNYNESAIISMIRNDKPVPFRGKREGFLGIPGSGHAWVIDGFIRQSDITGKHERYLFHCNWEWTEGLYNGYYYSGVFRVGGLGFKIHHEESLGEKRENIEDKENFEARIYSMKLTYINYYKP